MSDFFKRTVVCNTSPVISLCKAGLGHLLAALFPKVLTTTAVAAELMAVFGFEVAGTCALLLRAKKISLIPEVRAPLDRIIVNGLFISTRLRNECLRLAGE